MTLSTLGQYVMAGIEKFNAYDSNWFEEIDRDSLDVASLDNCPVAQTFRKVESYYGWSHGCQVLGVDSDEAFYFGFDIIEPDDYMGRESGFDRLARKNYNRRVLNRMWRYVVTRAVERRECMRRHPSYQGA